MRVTAHDFIADPALSISRGIPLSAEEGLGELTLGGFLREVAARAPDREALVHREGTALTRWSYRDLEREAEAVAGALVAAGLAKGERVGVLMTNRPEFLAATFGIALAGGVAAPIGTFSTPDELAYLIEVSAISTLLFERMVLKKDFLEILCDLDPRIASQSPEHYASARFPFLKALAMIGDGADGAIRSWHAFLDTGRDIASDRIEARSAAISPADPGVLFFSSGSTARPKGILSSHRGVALQMWRMGPQQGLADGVRSWTANGFFWSGNFAMIVGGTLAMGGTIVLQRTFQPAEALALMASERVQFLFAWPHQWEQLVAVPGWLDVDLSALTYIDAASPIARHPTVETDWIEPRHCYGNTETFTLSAAYPAQTRREEAAGSHGLPLPGNILKIVDPLTGRTMPLGDRGELAVKGPTLMLGYLGVPLDETLDQDGFFRTGDGGWLDDAGRLHWEGRLNDIIKTGGANVSPLEIDEVIRECAGVKLAQTVGVPHETLGEIVVACVALHQDADLSEDALRSHARTRLASYKVPRRVLFFTEEDLAVTGSNKIRTSELRRAATERLAMKT
ncbi:class I adenylate-forming enzyme family protein [Novosphingobium resinovorum]|uniref:class I adenylate-forming enzyme family protein n=1 Tax=Novosphingobium resinovorum TaxID=158500 RepID=UPI002ECFD064|nr:class I adenylate-forming enzyme family protein [Novosphingobium resinovorum]